MTFIQNSQVIVPKFVRERGMQSCLFFVASKAFAGLWLTFAAFSFASMTRGSVIVVALLLVTFSLSLFQLT